MKRSLKFRILSLILCVITLSLSFVGCSSKIKSSEEDSRIVGRIGDNEIRYEEVRYLTMAVKDRLEAKYGDDIYNELKLDVYEEMLKDEVLLQLCEIYAIVELCKTEKILISDRQTKKEVKEYVKEAKQTLGSKESYEEYLTESYMTDYVFRLNSGILSCQYRYYEKLFADMEREAYDAVLAQEGFIHTMSIFIKNDKGESVEDNRRAAEYVREQIGLGKDISEFIGTKYNQDMSSCEYYFIKGYFDENYENAAFALEIGETSGVVECEDGFYLIKRLELKTEDIQDNFEDLVIQYVTVEMNKRMKEVESSLSVELNDFGKTIEFLSMQ